MSSSEEDIHEVENIVDKRKCGKCVEYLVQWKGYSSKHNSWEPASNLSGCRGLVREFNTEYFEKESRNKRQKTTDIYNKPYIKTMRSARVSPLHRTDYSIKTRSPKSGSENKRFSSHVNLTRTARKLSLDSRSKRHVPKTFHSTSTVTNNKVDGPAITGVVAPLPSSMIGGEVPQKIFTVNENKHIVNKWFQNKEDSRTSPVVGDHNYIFSSTNAYRKPFPKPPVTFQPPPLKHGSAVASRKSTLRKGRVFQERLVLLQWRQNFVEIIFANTSRDNALTPRFLAELSNALDAVVASKCPVVVVNTVGNTFCSGMDVKFLIETLNSSKCVPESAKYLAEALRNFVDKLIEFQRILIAIVQGPAIGLGCAMLALFDTVYCSDKAWFWTPYTSMGQTPECCTSLLFPEILGPATANNMLLNGARLTAREAKFHGLVTEVFPHDSLKRNAMSLVERTAAMNGEALQITKSLMRGAHTHRLKHANYAECRELAERWASQDAVGTLMEFFHKIKDEG